MCLLALVVCGALHGQQRSSATRSLSPEIGFARLRSKIDVERAGDLTTNAVAGQYSSSPDELHKRVVPLSGDELYLFPDGSYIYLFWSDGPARNDSGQRPLGRIRGRSQAHVRL